MRRLLSALLLLVLAARDSRAEAPKFVLRMAMLPPEGSLYTRESRIFARDVAAATDGAVNVKWYFGGVAGNELEVEDRIKRGQIDGMGSGGAICQRAAPSMRIFSIPGLFQDRDEADRVAAALTPLWEEEFQRSGYMLLEATGLGQSVIFSRRPIQTMADLKKTRLWQWSDLPVSSAALEMMGLNVVRVDVPDAAAAYERGDLDGFITVPGVALAWQWSAQTRYFTKVNVISWEGCFIIASRAFDRLPIEYQRAVRAAGAKLNVRLRDGEHQQDDALVGGVFERQGLKLVPLSETFRAQIFEAARNIRPQIVSKFGLQSVLERVQAMLADYRAERAGR
jgi:TRAP-type C4-dicarboxylate transport system substrate-binding protein